MPARRTIPRRRLRSLRDLPPAIRPTDPPPNAGNAPEAVQALWEEWLAAHLPDADSFRALLAAPSVTVADVIETPTTFPTVLDHALEAECPEGA